MADSLSQACAEVLCFASTHRQLPVQNRKQWSAISAPMSSILSINGRPMVLASPSWSILFQVALAGSELDNCQARFEGQDIQARQGVDAWQEEDTQRSELGRLEYGEEKPHQKVGWQGRGALGGHSEESQGSARSSYHRSSVHARRGLRCALEASTFD